MWAEIDMGRDQHGPRSTGRSRWAEIDLIPHIKYAETRDGAVSRGPVLLQPLVKYQHRHRNAQPAGVGPSGHA